VSFSLNKLAKSCYNAGTTKRIYYRDRVQKLHLARVLIIGAHVEGVLIDSGQLARAAVDAASDKKASDVIMLDIRDLTTIADYFVICTGNNPRQINAIADAIDEQLRERGARVLNREGIAETGWVLLDFGDIIVHIFGAKEREYYRLERLWSEAKTVVYLQ
jgi:ribosome-associated protein